MTTDTKENIVWAGFIFICIALAVFGFCWCNPHHSDKYNFCMSAISNADTDRTIQESCATNFGLTLPIQNNN